MSADVADDPGRNAAQLLEQARKDYEEAADRRQADADARAAAANAAGSR